MCINSIKKNWKKVIATLCCAVVIVCISLSFSKAKDAKAEDQPVVGTANLNGTAQNSAKVGNKLTAPEVGWQRYDDANNNILYSSKFVVSNMDGFYKSSRHMEDISSGQETIKFAFYGSKLRLVDSLSDNRTKNSKISFDQGKTFEPCSAYGNESWLQAMYYEKTGLEKKIHNVIITIPAEANMYFCLDALDIDSDGYLLPYSDKTVIDKTISLDKTSMSINAGDSQQLTATTTPASIPVTWGTSDSSIVTVDQSGKVTALKSGNATITVKTNDGSNLSATCAVTVNENTTETGGRSILIITMSNNERKEFDLSNTDIEKFVKWYNSNSNPSYPIEKNANVKPFNSRTDYIAHDKISSFEVNKYTDTSK